MPHQQRQREVAQHRDYRGAVALNNMAITLLERQDFCQAFVTMKDAVTVMKQMVVANATKQQSYQSNEIESRLHSAMLRLAKAPARRSSGKCNGSITRQKSNVEEGSLFGVISHHDHDLQGLQSVLLHEHAAPCHSLQSSSWTAYPIRLDDHGIEDVHHHRTAGDHDIASAIVTYNFAVAHVCMAKNSSKPSIANRLFKTAEDLFRIAECVLTHDSVVATCQPDAVQNMRRLLITVFVQSSVGMLFQELEKCCSAVQFRLSNTVQDIAIQQEDPDLLFHTEASSNAAAAAA